MPGVRAPLWVRFWMKVQRQPNGCWLWIGGAGRRRNKGFNGRLRQGGRKEPFVSPTRLVLTWSAGPPPTPDHEAAHSCPDGENSLCVNPTHLYWATREENEQDKRLYRALDTAAV
jgi:hypothetical protein